MNICGIVINSLPNLDESKKDLKNTFKKDFFNKTSIDLCPKDLSISFTNTSTIILLDMIFYKNIDENEKLTSLENDINTIFPNSKILIFVINETIDFTGYSYLINGLKIRTKAVCKNEIFLDYGGIFGKEEELYDDFISRLSNKSKEFLLTKFSKHAVVERKKYYLQTSDLANIKQGFENALNYTNGSLDYLMIENIFKEIIDMDLVDLVNLRFIQFQRRRFNFDKKSLKEFIVKAQNELTYEKNL